MTLPVFWLWDTPRDFWDWGLTTELLDTSGYEFTHHYKNAIDPADFGVVVVPGAYADITHINRELNKLNSCLVIITSDEARLFPIKKLNHQAIRVYLQTAQPGDKADRLLPLGAPLGFTPKISDAEITCYFAGQVTHKSRYELVKALEEIDGNVAVRQTDGFAKGDKDAYVRNMGSTILAPAPQGTVHPDSFRLYEALESGATPIVQADPYWNDLGLDIPQVETWDDLPTVARILKERYPRKNNEYAFQWQMYKRNLRRQLDSDIQELSGQSHGQPITVLIPTSPIPTHPDTSIIEETIQSVRDRLPDAEILVLADGVRTEQLKLTDSYEEYQRDLLRLSGQLRFNVMRFEEHCHQAIMTRRALETVDTPVILFMEHDTPLCEDIPFDRILPVLDSELDVVRFHFESHVLDVHQPLARGEMEHNGITYQKTAQWSQRPHLARTDYYRQILEKYFAPERKTMIEDVIHGIVQSGDEQPDEWGIHRIGIYDPGDGNLKRSYHTDGRGNEPKFEETF